MILGRSTPQWVALITATGGFIQLLLVTLVPDVDAVVVGTIIGGLTGLAGVWLAFLANTSTTPTSDPQLKQGTMVRVTDEAGIVVGHAPVPQP
jgi:hypothetical protein